MNPAGANLYIGTYSYGGSRGIYRARLNLESGAVSDAELAIEISDPGFLCYDAARAVLFCNANPLSGIGRPATAASFRVWHDGSLSPLSSVVIDGVKFCHLSLTSDGVKLFGASYGQAVVAAFAVDDGTIRAPHTEIRFSAASRAIPERQSEPHVHSAIPDVFDKYLFVCDFSGDCIRTYEIGEGPRLSPHGVFACAPGSGPRHALCHTDGKTLYVINELSSRIDRFVIVDGRLELCQSISSLPAEFRGENTAAEILLSPDAAHLYATNRGHDSIAVFRVADDGSLFSTGFVSSSGRHPRNALITPGGRLLLVANRDSDCVAVFRLVDGHPVYTGYQVGLSVPMGMAVVPDGAK